MLPFVNGTGNADNDYLSDGITDRLINGLTQVSSLRVVPRSLVYSYRDKNLDPLELGQQLDVAAMVTGRISQRDNRLTLAVELSDAREVAQVWGRQYESSLDDLLDLQDSISTELVKQLRVRVSEAGRSAAQAAVYREHRVVPPLSERPLLPEQTNAG